MKAAASILFLYLIALFIQPVVFPLHEKEGKPSCCASKKDKSNKGCPEKNKGCCDTNQCNPFFSQCPLCSANAVTIANFAYLPSAQEVYFTNIFLQLEDDIISQYQADILHPPQVV